ncbi:hypothetical protein E4U61_006813 [Claviceps capensis]|nr:hypothetical protein E4U61_006813 [Claviceps capensis]
MAVPSRVHREVVIKGTTISDAVTRRKPEEIVTAVIGAIKAPVHAVFEAVTRSLPSRSRLVPMSRPTDG